MHTDLHNPSLSGIDRQTMQTSRLSIGASISSFYFIGILVDFPSPKKLTACRILPASCKFELSGVAVRHAL